MAIDKKTFKASLAETLNAAPANVISSNSPLAAMLGTATQGELQIEEFSLSSLIANTEQYHYSMNENELNTLANSIAEIGVIEPIHVRPAAEPGKYQILAGHRRAKASEMAGKTTISAFVRDVDEATAGLIFNVTNLERREKLLPSEKAYGYSEVEKFLAEKGATNGRTSAAIAELTGDNVKQIQRYKRLLLLTPELLCMVDDGDMPVRAGVDISHLSQKTQKDLLAIMNGFEISALSMKQAADIRELADDEGEIPAADIRLYFKPGAKSTLPKPKKLKVDYSAVASLVPQDIKPKEFEELVVKALQAYFSSEEMAQHGEL